MSQIAMLTQAGSASPDLETLTGDVGGAVGVDAAFNINILGGTGITVTGNPATNTLTIDDDDLIQGTVTTVGAVTSACITFPMGAAPGTYIIDGRIAAYNVTDVAGGGYFFSAAIRTSGAAGTAIAVEFGSDYEEASMVAADCDVTVAGNNILVNVLGIALKTINWSAEFEYQFVGV